MISEKVDLLMIIEDCYDQSNYVYASSGILSTIKVKINWRDLC